MNIKRLMALCRSYDLDGFRAALIVFVCVLGILSVLANYSGQQGFVSSEVKFTDASHSGLQIIPASCPSSPDYAGQCSLPVDGTCGLDVSLVMDVSGSIDNTELSQMKTALQSFVSALLPETPTLFSVVSFDNLAVVRSQFFPNGNNLTSVNSTISSIDGSGSTNWQGALLASQSTFDPRPAANNLVIFASDGNPNTINNATGGYTSVSESTAVSAAVTVANSIKSSGTRILAIGIGNGLDAANLQAIASPNSVFLSNFSTLATDLASIAREQCGGTITVKKIYDVDGNLGTTNDQAPASGWDFTVAGVSQTTDFLGYTEPFKVSGFGPWSVEEIQQSGHTILGASCTGATDNGTLSGSIVNGIIGGIQLNQDNIVSCVFYNTGGTLGPDLTALNTSPTSATIDVATTLTAIITNAGVGSTGISFPNFFQVASAANGGGTITDLTPAVSLSSLRGGTSNTISLPHTFTAGGTYSTRACADKSSSTDAGIINEGANEGNNCSEWVNVNVPFPPPSCSVNLSPDSVVGSQSSTLTWSSTNATAMSISGVGAVSLSGSTSVVPGVSTTYIGSVSGPGGDSTCTVTLNVLSCSISFDSNPINPTQTTNLNYTSSGASSFTIANHGNVSVASPGSVAVSPVSTTDYTGTVEAAASGAQKVIFLTDTTATSWIAPADFFPPWKIEVIGGGGGGEFGSDGGGGGAYSKITHSDLSLSPGQTIYVKVGSGGASGIGGGDSWINKDVSAPPTSTTNGVLAKGGEAGTTGGGPGGASAQGIGSVKYSGGKGGADGGGTQRRAGGGGAAGPGGVGGVGGNGSATTDYAKGGGGGASTLAGPGNAGAAGDTDGGNGGANGSGAGAGTGATGSSVATNGTVGGGGGGGFNSGSYAAGGYGGAGTIWTQTAGGATAGPGGGSGGGGTGDGGLYGGGGGAAGTSPGTGAQGIIVVTYSPSLPLSTSCPAILTVNPPSGTFTLTPSTISQGGSATLSWTNIGGASWTIYASTATTGPTLFLTGSSADGSVVVTPSYSTTYTGSITGPSGIGSFSPATLDVTCAPVYSCSGNTIQYKNASCIISNVTTCVSPGFCSPGSSVCLYPPPTPTPSSTLTGNLQVFPSIVRPGVSTKLYWNMANVSSCSVTSSPDIGSWVGATNVAGGQATPAINQRTVFNLSCVGLDGSTFTGSATVSIVPTFQEAR